MNISTNPETKAKRTWLRGLQDFMEAFEHEEIDSVWEHLLALNNRVNELEFRLQALDGTSTQFNTSGKSS